MRGERVFTSDIVQQSNLLLAVIASSVLASSSPFTVHNLISLRVHDTMFPCSYHSNVTPPTKHTALTVSWLMVTILTELL